MAESSELDLPYGHFGHAEYISSERRWRFQRQEQSRTALKPLGPSITYLNPPDGAKDEIPPGKPVPPSIQRRNQIAELEKFNPDLQIVEHLLDPLLQTSQVIQNAAQEDRTIKGNMMTFSQLVNPKTHRPNHVAAVVTKDDPASFRFFMLGNRRCEWADSQAAWLEVPTFDGQFVWEGRDALPIQQIQFSAGNEPGLLRLAVRKATKLQLYQAKVTATVHELRLQPKLIDTVGADIMAGKPFADVSYSPWASRQIATVDVTGGWCILEERINRVTKTCTGPPAPTDETPAYVPNDGWARISWVTNMTTMIVATRMKVRLFSMDTDVARVVQDLEVKLLAPVPWIFDCKVLSSNPEYFCVLTSTHLILFHAPQVPRGDVHATACATIRHFRNPVDLSLKLALSETDKGQFLRPGEYLSIVLTSCPETLIILSSLSSSLTASYRVVFTDPAFSTFEDPQLLEPMNIVPGAVVTRKVISIHLVPPRVIFDHHEENRHLNNSLTRLGSHIDPSTQFYITMVLHDDFSVTETLSYTRDVSQASDRNIITNPTLRATTVTRLKQKIISQAVVSEDFEGDEEDLEEVFTHQMRLEPKPRLYRRAKVGTQNYRQPKNFENWAKRVHTGDTVLSIDEATDAIVPALVGGNLEDVFPIHSFRELVGSEIAFDDIDDDMRLLENFADTVKTLGARMTDDRPDPGLSVTMERTHVMNLPGLPAGYDHVDPSAIYDALVATWITPLTPEISARTRVTRDGLIRRVAADFALSNILLRIKPDGPPEPAPDTEYTQGLPTWDLPMRGGGGGGGYAPSQSALSAMSSSVWPTPSATPSITTASSRTSTLFAAPEYDRLRKYVRFTHPAPPAPPRAIRCILAHWVPGTSPAEYDWLATTRQLAQHRDGADEELGGVSGDGSGLEISEKERRRMQRRAERHLRRQRKEAEASAAQFLASSQVPEIFSAASQPAAAGPSRGRTTDAAWQRQQQNIPYSSPQRPSRLVAAAQESGAGLTSSQSIAAGPTVSASQPVAGRFGGRSPMKKKKRKQGF